MLYNLTNIRSQYALYHFLFAVPGGVCEEACLPIDPTATQLTWFCSSARPGETCSVDQIQFFGSDSASATAPPGEQFYLFVVDLLILRDLAHNMLTLFLVPVTTLPTSQPTSQPTASPSTKVRLDITLFCIQSTLGISSCAPYVPLFLPNSH